MAANREFLMEIRLVGGSVRVTAVDSQTGTEVTFQAPARTSRQDLKQLAISKLRYVLKKDK